MLAQLRTRRGLTQTEVAHRVGLGPSYFGRMEQGRRMLPPDVLWRLREVLAPPGRPHLSDADFLALAEWAAQAAEQLRARRLEQRQSNQATARRAPQQAAS